MIYQSKEAKTQLGHPIFRDFIYLFLAVPPFTAPRSSHQKPQLQKTMKPAAKVKAAMARPDANLKDVNDRTKHTKARHFWKKQRSGINHAIHRIFELLSTNNNGHFPWFCMRVIGAACFLDLTPADGFGYGNFWKYAGLTNDWNLACNLHHRQLYKHIQMTSSCYLQREGHRLPCSPVHRSFEISRSKPNGRTLDQMWWSQRQVLRWSICTLFNSTQYSCWSCS